MESMNTKEILKKDGHQYIIFYLGDKMFGIDMLYLQEIMRVPDIVEVPSAPAYIRGITNLRGTILTIVDCRLRLRLERIDDTESTRVIVLTAKNKKLGYVVDRLVGVLSFNEDELEKGNAPEFAQNLVERVVKVEDSDKLVMLLDAKKLLNLSNKDLKENDESTENTKPDIFNVRKEENINANAKQLQMISFKIGEGEYGIEVTNVQEIVRFSGDIHEVPNVPPYILGIISLRNRVLPIVSLRRLFNMEECAFDERSRIVVAKMEENDYSYLVGFKVDLVLEVLRIDKDAVLPVPPLLNAEDINEISGICSMNEGNRLVYVLDSQKLFKDRLKENVDVLRIHIDDQKMNVSDTNNDEDKQLVSFLIDSVECAFPIEDVKEIISATEIMIVPNMPDFVEGVINMRGTIVPIIDLRKKFGLQEKIIDDYNRIVLVDISGKYTGLIVDSIKEVLKVGCSQIDSVPEVLADEIEESFIEGIVKFESSNRMIVLLSVKNILSGEEREKLMTINRVNNEVNN